jgi:hypothetical protein
MDGDRDTMKKFSALLHDLTSILGFATATWSSLLFVSILLITRINMGNTSELEWLFVSVDTACEPNPYLLFRFDRIIMTSCQLSG